MFTFERDTKIIALKIVAHTYLPRIQTAHIAIVRRFNTTFYIEFSRCHSHKTEFKNVKAIKHKLESVVLVRIYSAHVLCVFGRQQNGETKHCITHQKIDFTFISMKGIFFHSIVIVFNPFCIPINLIYRQIT